MIERMEIPLMMKGLGCRIGIRKLVEMKLEVMKMEATSSMERRLSCVGDVGVI